MLSRYYLTGRTCLRVAGHVTRAMSTTSSCQASQVSPASAASDEVILDRRGNKGIITLNRPKALNALNLSMIRQIYPQLKSWESDSAMKMVVIKATGDKAFCAGGDVKSIAEAGKNSQLAKDFFSEEYRLNNLIGSISVPYISFINGIVMGGGVGLTVHGAFRVVTEKALFAMPETQIGFFPDVGGSHFLPRLPGKLGLFLGLTGHRLQGRDIFKAGIATHFVPSAHLDHLEEELLRLDKPDIGSIDKILRKYQEQWEQDYRKEFSLKEYIGRINAAFGADSVEGIVDNLTKDGSDWAKKQADILSRMSPISLKVSFEELKRGQDLTLPECLKMEYRLSQHFMNSDDFFTGVSAVLIDKSKSPKWKHSSLSEVSDAEVQSYFESLPDDRKDLLL